MQPITSPNIIARPQHLVSRSNINEGALRVLYRLKEAGFQAYLVGGCVRDLLLGREPKDFDVATDATPEQVKGLFRSCHLVGRRFRLAHVRMGPEVVEVATFRAAHAPEEQDGRLSADGRILRDNVFGSIEEDAWRRDFTVNALYYNIRDFSVVDYVGGMNDLRTGLLRLIGNPESRYREDPVRMLRAVRFAAKLGFRLHPETEAPLGVLAALLTEMPAARLFEEVLKLFLGGSALQTYELLRHYDLFRYLFPMTELSLAHEERGFPVTLVAKALANTDTRVLEGRPVTPAFLMAALLWEPVRDRAADLKGAAGHPAEALYLSADEVLAEQRARVAIPRRFAAVAREIWALQPRFGQRSGKRPHRLMGHPRFRAAYDFLVLRAEAGEEPQELADWWTGLQEGAEPQPGAAVGSQPARRRRGRRRRSARSGDAP